ncbi:hypothetical protein BV330_00038 [Pseudomonas syringae pv. actinidiae]|nr:hypothetical protein BV330_00038 [Pseudomonas syringae pv. actinidiae]OSR98496.1 hypothetical protein BV331_00036 [Pseudomonas syringae pv. actinidiae]
MPHSAHYRIEYVHNGADKSFYVSAEIMSNAECLALGCSGFGGSADPEISPRQGPDR